MEESQLAVRRTTGDQSSTASKPKIDRSPANPKFSIRPIPESLPPQVKDGFWDDLDELEESGVTLAPSPLIPNSKSESQLRVYLTYAGMGIVAISALVFIAWPSSTPTTNDALLATNVSPDASAFEATKVEANSTSNALDEKANTSASTGSIVEESIPSSPNESDTDGSAVPINRTSSDLSGMPMPSAAKSPVPASADEGSQLPISNPAAQGDTQPLADNLYSEIVLPPIRKDNSGIADKQATARFVNLGEISDNSAGQLQISIDQPKYMLASAASFFVDTQDSQAAHEWRIHLKLASNSSTQDSNKEASQLNVSTVGFEEPIATITMEENQLRFRWGQPKYIGYAEHLRNCTLVLRAGGVVHRTQLRPTQKTNRFVMDLTQRNISFDIDGEYLPAAESIHLHVTAVKSAGVDFELDPENGIIERGETLRVKLLGWDNPVELQFKLIATKLKTAVIFSPRYEFDKKLKPLTKDDLDKAMFGRDITEFCG